jgi:GH25 family lysozyme M1 (1,4-beta-N-acetylmuramidase)
MADHGDVLTSNGLVTEELVVTPVPAPRPTPDAPTTVATARKTFRVITANVQSVPRTALTLGQAREDLRANAADGDLVMLQEIDSRYRRIVAEEFPSTDWHVFFGPPDNRSPIAARKDTFDLLDQGTELIHSVRVGLHGRRYLTHVHLRHRELGSDLHAVNVHLTPGAFSTPPPVDAAGRQAEWREGMRRHDRFVEDLVGTGAPVIGGGDYNRQLRAFQAEAAMRAGRRVAFGVDTASIDLIWFIDGATATWSELGRDIFRGREGRPRRRNSDHAARQATVALTSAAVTVIPAPVASAPRPKKSKKTGKAVKPLKPAKAKDVASFAPAPRVTLAGTAQPAPGGPLPFGIPFAGPADSPFALTEFGDVRPKKVDWKTRAALEEAERRLGYRLTVVQGSYNNGKVKASGPTHDGGGVVDLLAWDWRRKVRVLREVGFAAWHRVERPGLWGEHIHAVLIEHGRLDPSAARQVVAYRAGLDGLKGSRVDDFPRPNPIPVFRYPPAPAVPMLPAVGEARRDSGVEPLGKAYPPRRTLDGVDISHHQSGRMDLTAAKAAGLRWWYVKATEGTSFRDNTYRKRVRQARAAGLPVGAYHFARPENGDAVAEARFFLKNIELRAGDMVPMLDLEDIGDLTLTQLTTWTGAWVRTVTQELRRKGLTGKPVIYTPFNLEKGFVCLLWVARYSDDFRAPVIPRPWRRAAIWQHSNGKFGPVKNVPGIGRVDVNALHPDLPLSALRLRPVGQPAKGASGKPRRERVTRPPVLPLETLAPADVGTGPEPVGVVTQPVPVDQLPAGSLAMPTVVTTTNGSTSTDAGSIVITLTVPLPVAPAPVVVTPDLTPLEEQLTLAAKSLQGAIEALPERSEP